MTKSVMRATVLALVGVGCGSAATKTAVAPPLPPTTTTTTTVATTPAAPSAPAPAAYQGLGADSVSPETVARFAAPPVDAQLSSKVQAMLDVRGFPGQAVLSSRGDRMFFTWSVTGVGQVWRQDGPDRFPVQLTGGEDATEVVDITPDDRFLVVQRDRGGAENPGVYLLPVDGGPLQEIHRKPKVQTFHQFVSDDGRYLYYSANDVDQASRALYRHELATGRRETVLDAPGLWNIVDHRGDRLLLSRDVGNIHNEIHELDLVTRQRRLLLGEGDEEHYEAAYGARDGTLIVCTQKLGNFYRLYEWKAGRLTPISPDVPHDVHAMIVDPARRAIVYALNDGGRLRTRALDARTYKPLAMPIAPADLVTPTKASRSGRFAVVLRESANLPASPVVWDWKTRKATRWQLPSAPEVDLASFAPVTLESYPARDGTPIPMLVRRPARCATEACPVIVEFHGGPESQAMAGFSTGAQLYVDAGFIHVRPNVRGSAGYGKAWLHADDGPRRLEVITDIEDCAKFIRTAWAKNGVAPRIGVVGGSYGGYSVLMAMTYFAGAYDAGVSIVGIANLHTFLANTAPYRRILRIAEYGDPEKDRDAMTQLSPTSHIGRIQAPLLLVQGVNDPRVPVGEALLFRQALEDRGIANGLILFPDEGHGAKKRSNVAVQSAHVLAFFEKHLK